MIPALAILYLKLHASVQRLAGCTKKEADPQPWVGLAGLRNGLSFDYFDFYPSVLGPALGSLVRGYRILFSITATGDP